MKTYIYTTVGKWNRNTGGSRVVAQVYLVEKNIPKHVAEVTWNTGSFKGEESTIMNTLAKNGVLPKKYSEGYLSDHPKRQFRFIHIQ